MQGDQRATDVADALDDAWTLGSRSGSGQDPEVHGNRESVHLLAHDACRPRRDVTHSACDVPQVRSVAEIPPSVKRTFS